MVHRVVSSFIGTALAYVGVRVVLRWLNGDALIDLAAGWLRTVTGVPPEW